MTTRKIEFPRIVMVGEGCLDSCGQVSKELSLGKNALVVAGETTMKVAGNHASEVLTDSGFKVFTQFSEKATEETVSKAQESIKKNSINIALGVGGGNCIDTAKLAAFREKIPFISVPTAGSHDGIGSPIASIRSSEGTLKSQKAEAPIAILADTNIISKAPHKLLASGCADLVSNYTAVEDWKLAKAQGEYFGDYAAALSIMSARVMLESADIIKPNDQTSTKIVMEGLVSSGAAMCIAGTSRPSSGAEHMFSHALDKIAPTPAMHGEQCGVGTIMMASLHGLDWENFRDSLNKIGAPTTAKELGIEPEYIIKALAMADSIRDRYTILREKPLDENSAEELAKKTGVI